MQTLKLISGIAAVLNVDNIDTDQIIPAEHLKITNKSGLGRYLFSNWRFSAENKEVESFVLNQPATSNCKILITGKNFGCGSSREHAPWALLDFGIQVVISTSIADIFRNNSIKNGLLPIIVNTEDHQYLLLQNAQAISIDIETQMISLADKVIPFEIEAFTRYCFLNGLDQLDFLLQHQDAIHQYEQRTRKVI